MEEKGEAGKLVTDEDEDDESTLASAFGSASAARGSQGYESRLEACEHLQQERGNGRKRTPQPGRQFAG